MIGRAFAAVFAVFLIVTGALVASACQSQTSSPPPAAQTPAPPPPNPRFLANDLPLLPDGVDRGVAPLQIIQASYEFAARHPEVMKYVPCFCGCERGGHKDNHDCFVTARDASNKVVSWEPHGLVCEICISVAYQARQMHSSGASVADIRKAIEDKYAPVVAERHFHTPTPPPPKSGNGG